MKNILITGGTGLIGTDLSKEILRQGYNVTLLTRKAKSENRDIPVAYWDPAANKIDRDALSRADVIIHLAGTNVGRRRWTTSRKKSIVESRINTCKFLFDEVRKSNKKPELFISASGVGYYGAITTDHIFDETDPPGKDFLAETCKKWEDTVSLFTTIGVRTVIFRNGLVLAPDGGIIQRLYLPFKLGLGTTLGTGFQFLPWVHINDLCHIYTRALRDEEINGVFNVVAPEQIRFHDFSSQLAAALNRRIWMPRIPPFVLKIVLGEMSEIVLEGSRVSNEKIRQSGYRFIYPDLKSALEDIIKAPR